MFSALSSKYHPDRAVMLRLTVWKGLLERALNLRGAIELYVVRSQRPGDVFELVFASILEKNLQPAFGRGHFEFFWRASSEPRSLRP